MIDCKVEAFDPRLELRDLKLQLELSIVSLKGELAGAHPLFERVDPQGVYEHNLFELKVFLICRWLSAKLS